MYRGIKTILFAGLVLFASVETTAQQRIAQQEGNQTLIEAQALGSALQVLAEEYDLQVLFESAVVANYTARAIPQGTSGDAALGDLLAGTGLTYEFVNERTVAIRGVVDDVVSEYERGDSDSKNFGVTPVLMVQNTSQTSPKRKQTTTDMNEVMSSDEEDVSRLEEIIVTGTNIRGVENPTVPVLTFDKEDIDLSGASTVDEFLRTIPQNFASNTQLTIESGRSDAGLTTNDLTQGTTVDLRGLGPGSTLTLLNGRRMTPAGNSNFVDVSVLPLGIIERVDVLTDGATAVYGSDAVGGVINFVTRGDYEGLEVNARYGTVTDGSQEDWGYGAAGGFNWESGGVFGGVDYEERRPLLFQERKFVDLTRLPNGGGVFGSTTERVSVAGGAKQAFGSSIRVGVDVLYSDVTNESDSVLSFFPATNSSGQEALFVNSRVEYDILEDVTVSLFFDYGRNEGNYTADLFFPGFFQTIENAFENQMSIFEGHISGELLDLPGGAISFSVGGLHREENYDSNQGNGLLVIDTSRDVVAGYAEFLVPIIGEANKLSFVQELQFSLAARYEDYSGVGDTLDPKIGVYWAVNNQLSVRASFAESFRAPDLQSLSQRRQFYVSIFPIDSITAFTPPAPSPLVPLFSGIGDGVLYIYPVGSNPELQTESATSWSAGFAYEPRLIDGLRIEGNYFDIRYSDRIGRVRTAQPFQDSSFSELVNLTPSLAEVQSFFDRADAGEIDLVIPRDIEGIVTPEDIQLIVLSGVQNIAERDIRGFDLNANYARDTDWGVFSVAANAAYLIDYIGRLAPTSPSVEQVDVLYWPVDFKLRGSVSWTNRGFTAFAAVNYVGGYRDNIDKSVANGIDAWTTVDLSLAYNSGDRLDSVLVNDIRFGFTVTNLFDSDPPFVTTPFGLNYDSANANPFGRQVNLTLSKSF